jgi:hypothetical protein
MALNRRLQNKDTAQELILDSDSDAHVSQGGICPYQSTSDSKGDDRTDTQWTDSTQFLHFEPVIHKFTGGSSAQGTQYKHKLFPTGHFMLLFS